MGAKSSVEAPLKPLVPQHRFEATIYRRYIKEMVVTLEFEDQFWSKAHDQPIEIKDVDTNKVLFRVPPSKPAPAPPPPPPPAAAAGETPSTTSTSTATTTPSPVVRKILQDGYGVPVVGMEAYPVLPAQAKTTEYVVIPGGSTATKELFRFVTRFNMFEHPLELALHQDDKANSVQFFVTRKWLPRRAYITVKRGETGVTSVIARIYASDVRAGKFRMDIAPGVDLALMVLFAAAMEEQNPQYATSVDKEMIKHAIKQAEKTKKKNAQAKGRTPEVATE